MIALSMRVWDKNAKKMTYLPPLMPMVLASGEFLGMFTTVDKAPVDEKTELASIKASGYVLMYATGKTDLAGEPIFDGDIVECDVRMLESIGSDAVMLRKGVVGWKGDAMGFNVFLNHREGEVANASYSVGNMRKLGNVYEHADLLPDFKEARVAEVTPPQRSTCCNAVALPDNKKHWEGDGKGELEQKLGYTCAKCQLPCGVADEPLAETARGDISECCSALVKTEWYADEHLTGGGKHMHECTSCHKACTVK